MRPWKVKLEESVPGGYRTTKHMVSIITELDKLTQGIMQDWISQIDFYGECSNLNVELIVRDG